MSTYPFSYIMPHNDTRGGLSLMKFWNSEKLSNFKVHVLWFTSLNLYNPRWKKIIYQISQKNYENNLKLKFCALVPIASSSCPDTGHMCRWTLWTTIPSLVSSSKQNTRVKKDKGIWNILQSLFFTVCLNVTFADNWQNLRT